MSVGRDVRPEMVRALNLDVCVVLSNVTYGWNEYICFAAHRLGRVQVINYCSPITVGFRNIDRVIVSEALAASTRIDTQYLEQPAVLAGSEICFPSWVREAVTVSCQRPREADAEIVFASGASMFKVSASCRRAWVEILARLPDARLVLYPFNPNWGKVSPGCFAFRQVLQEECRAADISPERIAIEGPWGEREKIYGVLGRCDIYLDSFPHSGGLSTIDAIRLGRPFVTLTGDTQREQQSAALARNLGCDELIASSWDEYVGLACELARRPDLREDIGARILQRLPSAEFGDEESFKRRFGRLIDQLVDDARTVRA
jgi:predicted O-linked N-acetylglucosamine transferase (SPINDLY family)